MDREREGKEGDVVHIVVRSTRVQIHVEEWRRTKGGEGSKGRGGSGHRPVGVGAMVVCAKHYLCEDVRVGFAGAVRVMELLVRELRPVGVACVASLVAGGDVQAGHGARCLGFCDWRRFGLGDALDEVSEGAARKDSGLGLCN